MDGTMGSDGRRVVRRSVHCPRLNSCHIMTTLSLIHSFSLNSHSNGQTSILFILSSTSTSTSDSNVPKMEVGWNWKSLKDCIQFLTLVSFVSLQVVLTRGEGLGGVGGELKYIGGFQQKSTYGKVSGEVYAVNENTLFLKNFNYDGAGPDAFFWTGSSEHPSPDGVIIPDERGTKEVLKAYKNQDITITLPDGLRLSQVKWLSIWCRAYEVNFADIYIPQGLFSHPPPQPPPQVVNVPLVDPIGVGQYIQQQPKVVHLNSIVPQSHGRGHPTYVQPPPPLILIQQLPQHESPLKTFQQSSHTTGIHRGVNPPPATPLSPQVSRLHALAAQPFPHPPLTYSLSSKGVEALAPIQSQNYVQPPLLTQLVSQEVADAPLGSNGFSTITFRTSKGQSSTLSLY